MNTEQQVDRVVAVLRDTMRESGHDVSEQTARYVVGNLLVALNTPGPCPTDPACVLTADQHDDWRHADADGDEWPVMPREVTEAMLAAETARRFRRNYPMGPSGLSAAGKAVHHIDGDATNNDPANLRVVDLSANASDTRERDQP